MTKRWALLMKFHLETNWQTWADGIYVSICALLVYWTILHLLFLFRLTFGPTVPRHLLPCDQPPLYCYLYISSFTKYLERPKCILPSGTNSLVVRNRSGVFGGLPKKVTSASLVIHISLCKKIFVFSFLPVLNIQRLLEEIILQVSAN